MATTPRRPSRTQPPSFPNRHGTARTPMARSPPSYDEASREKSSLNITQKLEHRLARLNTSDNVLKRWLFEIISWSISAACIGAIIFILLMVKDSNLPSSSLGLTAYTILSKVVSAALILPTSEALGQLKWDWFNGRKSKEMWDFEIFDKASRGAWGSVLLLFRTKGRSLAALGAILTLLLIANDTFFQQVVNMPERWTLRGNSSIAMAVWYEPSLTLELREGFELSQTDSNFAPSLTQYLYANGTQPVFFGNGSRPEIPIYCPATNCTFPEYKTLGVCSQCTDVSRLLQFGCAKTRADWIGNLTGGLSITDYPITTACGYFFNLTSNSPVLMSGYSMTAASSSHGSGPAGEALLLRNLPLAITGYSEPLWAGSVNFKNIRNPIFDSIIVASKQGAEGVYRNETPVAYECNLHWCVKQMISSYSDADYDEKVDRIFTNSTAGPDPWIVKPVLTPTLNGTDMTYTENVTIVAPDDGLIYGLDNRTHSLAYDAFSEILPSFLTTVNSTAEPVFRYKIYSKGPLYRVIKFNPWLPPNNITHHLERIATTMTNLIRSSDSNEMVAGVAFNRETFVSVEWAWLTFPITLLVLSLVFLVATISKTSSKARESGPGAWKTSAMPALIYSLPSEMQKQFTSNTNGASSSNRTENLRLRLHPRKGWRVSGQPLSPDSPVMVIRSNQPPPGWI